MYYLKKRRRPEDDLTPEEQEVQRALSDYVHLDNGASITDFVPTRILYQLYREYRVRFTDEYSDAVELTPRQFGAALCRVYPHLDDDREAHRVRREYAGKRMWGYIGLKGPLSIKARDQAGRPQTHDVEDHYQSED
jgi:hypothetical protein